MKLRYKAEAAVVSLDAGKVKGSMVVQSEKRDQLVVDEEREMTSSRSSTGGLKQKDDGNDGNVTDDDICTEDLIGREVTDMQGRLPPGTTIPDNITKQETEKH